VIFNRVGSDRHEQLLREALDELGLPVLGALRRDERVATPERHLGLVPADEREPRAAEALAALADAVARACDMAAIEQLARSAPPLPGPAWGPPPSERAGGAVRIAIARGPAFSFHYEENLELLAAAGAELAGFDPVGDESLPEGARGLILAGGFPEVFGAELAANRPLRANVAAFAAAGHPVLAECGGLLYLARELDGHEMCGVLPVRGELAGRLTLGYRVARAATPTPWLAAGQEVRGHEFHYSRIGPLGPPDAPPAPSEPPAPLAPPAPSEQLAPLAPPAWELSARGTTRPDGFVHGGVQAGYLHVHWAAHPRIAERFVAAAVAA
jgi:cobyrinic acid a,c-diamide synthase